MKKKIFAIILSLSMILGMAGCGQEISQNDLQSMLDNTSISNEIEEVIPDQPQEEIPVSDTNSENVSFDITDEGLDPKRFTSEQIESLEVYEDQILGLNWEHDNLSEYAGRWIKITNISGYNFDDDNCIIQSLCGLSYVFESYDYEGYGYASSDVAMGYSFNVIGYIRYDGNIGDFAVMHAMYDGPSITFDESFTSIADAGNETYLLSAIIDEYFSNMAAFAQRYEGKTIIMDGVTIGQIDFADTLWVNLENGDIAVCSADVSEIAKIEVGRTYNIIGTFDLYADMQFTLNDCTFELIA